MPTPPWVTGPCSLSKWIARSMFVRRSGDEVRRAASGIYDASSQTVSRVEVYMRVYSCLLGSLLCIYILYAAAFSILHGHEPWTPDWTCNLCTCCIYLSITLIKAKLHYNFYLIPQRSTSSANPNHPFRISTKYIRSSSHSFYGGLVSPSPKEGKQKGACLRLQVDEYSCSRALIAHASWFPSHHC
jgi:hypothetical protein